MRGQVTGRDGAGFRRRPGRVRIVATQGDSTLLDWAVFMVATAAPAAAVTACPIDPPVAHDAAWRSGCDAAIAAATEPRLKAELLFRSAYAHNEDQGYFDAERELQEAVGLDPTNVSAWQELSYTENSLGNYAPAERAADRALALAPDHIQPYQERAMARHYQGNFEGAFADRDRVSRLQPDKAGPLIGRADEELWLGRFAQAAADLDAAASRAQRDDERREIEQRRALLSRWRTRSGAGDPAAACAEPRNNDDLLRPGLIGDCTAAFLAATSPTGRAELLTTRSLAWLVAAQDQGASTQDRAIAAALDPGNPNMRFNLGFAYLQVHHSWAAAREFDRGLAIRENPLGLAGRASAKYNLRDPAGALADARRSLELQPNELAFTVVGDLSRDAGHTAAARDFWLQAYRLGDRDEGLLERLRSIHVDHPETEANP